MQAGLELDQLIEEYVFKSSYTGDAPPYSTSIEAAWQVVEELVKRGKVFIVKGDGLRTGDHKLKWTVLCDNQPRVDAETAPLAICKAAFKAVGVEVA